MSNRGDVKTVFEIAVMFQLVPIKDVKERDSLVADLAEKVKLVNGEDVTHGLILPNGDVLLLCKANGWTDSEGLYSYHSVNKRSHETGKWEVVDKYYPEEFEPAPEMGDSEGLFGGFFHRMGNIF
ncbi:MAG: hypothetical protein U9M90_03320 [Patescibacteria group bacterium]|nr:hypothetical protein [Patescibacteria group bacterium]